jgi:hypothetical protein
MNSYYEFENRTRPIASRAAVLALVASLSAIGTLKTPLVRVTPEEAGILVNGLPADEIGLEDLFEVELDSPDFVPDGLGAFAARGFERRNRWS